MRPSRNLSNVFSTKYCKRSVNVCKAGKTVLDRGSRSDRPRYRVTAPTRAGLYRCRWRRPRHAARLAALARSWWRHNNNVLSRSSVNTQPYNPNLWPWRMALIFNPRRAMVVTHTHTTRNLSYRCETRATSRCRPYSMHCLRDIRLRTVAWPWNWELGSLKVIESATIR